MKFIIFTVERQLGSSLKAYDCLNLNIRLQYIPAIQNLRVNDRFGLPVIPLKSLEFPLLTSDFSQNTSYANSCK